MDLFFHSLKIFLVGCLGLVSPQQEKNKKIIGMKKGVRKSVIWLPMLAVHKSFIRLLMRGPLMKLKQCSHCGKFLILSFQQFLEFRERNLHRDTEAPE